MAEKSAQKIADGIANRIEVLIKQELPMPDCKLKRENWRWKVEQVKKNLAARLDPQTQSPGEGLEIAITI
jgi:hypothetical protein